MVNLSIAFVLTAAVLMAATVASALYVSSVAGQMSNSSSGAKNMTNATMTGNMTKKMTNMTSRPFKPTNKTK
jgi:hypothetical protein